MANNKKQKKTCKRNCAKYKASTCFGPLQSDKCKVRNSQKKVHGEDQRKKIKKALTINGICSHMEFKFQPSTFVFAPLMCVLMYVYMCVSVCACVK